MEELTQGDLVGVLRRLDRGVGRERRWILVYESALGAKKHAKVQGNVGYARRGAVSTGSVPWQGAKLIHERLSLRINHHGQERHRKGIRENKKRKRERAKVR